MKNSKNDLNQSNRRCSVKNPTYQSPIKWCQNMNSHANHGVNAAKDVYYTLVIDFEANKEENIYPVMMNYSDEC